MVKKCQHEKIAEEEAIITIVLCPPLKENRTEVRRKREKGLVLVNLLEYNQVMLKFLIQQIAELQVLEQELGSLKKNAVCIIIFFRTYFWCTRSLT